MSGFECGGNRVMEFREAERRAPAVMVEIVRPEGCVLPSYATPGSAGMDLQAAENKTIGAGDWELVSTGLRISIPPGYEGQIRPRSGMSLKAGVTVLNAPGTIDSDYRGVIGVILINHSDQDRFIEAGDRIAQLVVAPVVRVVWDEVGSLSSTERGVGGFGHTGV